VLLKKLKEYLKKFPAIQNSIKWVKKKLNIKSPSVSGGEFKRRILFRAQTFYQTTDLVKVHYTEMFSSDPLNEWKNEVNWQRRLDNKFNSRQFVNKYGCKVPDLYYKSKNIDEIKFSSLPENFVIRPTFGWSSKLVYLMKDGLNLMDNKMYSNEELHFAIAQTLKENPNLEFLFEEFVKTEEEEVKIPNDYKFYTFNGEIAAIQLINRLSPKSGFSTFYDEKWNLIPSLNTYYPTGTYEQQPKCFDEMIDKVRTLSRLYEIFVRIDFYATPKGAIFGEFTPIPFRGSRFTLEAEKTLIKYWDRYCTGKI
jgi:hypothetical protein